VKHYKQVEFWLIVQCQAPRTNAKPPPPELQSSPIENFLVTVLLGCSCISGM